MHIDKTKITIPDRIFSLFFELRMDVNKVLYISQEIEPYLPAGPMATFGRTIAQGMQEHGAEVRTFMPRYGAINERRNQLHEVIRLSGVNIIIDDTDHPLIIKVATLQPTRLQVYFIDNDDYFLRHTSGALETATQPELNDERTIFFVRGVVETVKKLRWEPSIVHCTGWITALTTIYLKKIYADDPSFRNSKIIFSLFNDSFEGVLDENMIEKLKADGFTDDMLAVLAEGDGKVDYKKLNKLAIDNADAIVCASEDVDPELIAYAKASGKPFMENPAPDADGYYQFYKSL